MKRVIGCPGTADWSETDKAYFAGIVDGEGNINIWGCHNTKTLRVQIAQKPLLILEELRDKMGGSIYRNKNGVSVFVLHGIRASLFLDAIIPYMRLKKREGELAIQYQALMPRRGGDGRTRQLDTDMERRDAILKEFRGLHPVENKKEERCQNEKGSVVHAAG